MHKNNSLFTNTEDKKTLAIIHAKHTQELYTNMYTHATAETLDDLY